MILSTVDVLSGVTYEFFYRNIVNQKGWLLVLIWPTWSIGCWSQSRIL